MTNTLNKEKLVIGEYCINEVGAGNVPERSEFCGKWANNAVIDQITVSTAGYSGSGGGYDTGSQMTIFGLVDEGTTAKDKSTITNVPAGTRYEETDTRKIFRRKIGLGDLSKTGCIAYYPLNNSFDNQVLVLLINLIKIKTYPYPINEQNEKLLLQGFHTLKDYSHKLYPIYIKYFSLSKSLTNKEIPPFTGYIQAQKEY